MKKEKQMKNNSISIVLIVLAAVSIGCGVLGNLKGKRNETFKPTNTKVKLAFELLILLLYLSACGER